VLQVGHLSRNITRCTANRI